MTVRHYKILLATFAILLAGTVALAQRPMHHGMGAPGGPGHMVSFLTEKLALTDTQQAQVKEILAKEKTTMGPLMRKNGQIHTELMQEAISGTFNEAKIQALAAQQGQVEAALAVNHAKIASEIYNILTPEQQSKAKELLAQHLQHMQHRMQQHEQGQEPAPEQ